MNVFGARTDPDEARRQSAQKRKPSEEPANQRQRIIGAARRTTAHDPAMNKDLDRLDQADRPLPALLYLVEIGEGNRALAELSGEQVRGRDRILEGEVDPD